MHLKTEQWLNIALRFYATGSFQGSVGDSEGASQPSCLRIVTLVSSVLSSHCDDLVRFCVDQDICQQVSTGFYGSASK